MLLYVHFYAYFLKLHLNKPNENYYRGMSPKPEGLPSEL